MSDRSRTVLSPAINQTDQTDKTDETVETDGTSGMVRPPLAVVAPLLDWSIDGLRDLPWRATRDPWKILVSEVMLQQTQVARVIERWSEFLEEFPTATACANAGSAAVIERWAGLGYNRRAINLWRCAVAVRDDHGGVLPADVEQLLQLPGIGPYTARAVAVFAFEHDVAVVDTNVGRLLARWTGRSLTPRQGQAMADALVPAGSAWRWNQSLFDFAAAVCTKRSPGCPAARSERLARGAVMATIRRSAAPVCPRLSRASRDLGDRCAAASSMLQGLAQCRSTPWRRCAAPAMTRRP